MMVTPMIGVLCLSMGPAAAFGGKIGPVMVGDLLDSSATEGVAFAGADVACATSVVCPAAMTIGVLGMAAWETHDTWVSFGKWAWDSITSGGTSGSGTGTDPYALKCIGANGQYLSTSVDTTDHVTFTTSATNCGSYDDPPLQQLSYTCATTSPTTGQPYTWSGSLSNSYSTEIFYGHPITFWMTGFNGGACRPTSITTKWGWGGNSTWITVTWNGAAVSTPAASQSITTIENCHDGSGVSTDQLLQSVAPFIQGGVSITPCNSLGDNWYPTKVTVTRQASDGTGPAVTSTETFAPPTGQPKPVPGTQGNVVTGLNPTTGSETDAPPDPENSDDPSTAPAVGVDTTTTTGDACSQSWSVLHPLSLIAHGVECAMSWSFTPPSGFLDTWEGQLHDAWSATIIGKYLSPLTGILSVPGVEGCSGIHVHYSDGLAAKGKAVEIDQNLAAACPGDPLANAAGIVHAVLTALVVIGGAWGCIRLVVNAFIPGMVPPFSALSGMSYIGEGDQVSREETY